MDIVVVCLMNVGNGFMGVGYFYNIHFKNSQRLLNLHT